MNTPTPAHPNPFRFASPADAVAAVRAELAPGAAEHMALHQAHGRILAAPALADRDSPALDISAMDGFAIRTTDLAALASADGLAIAPSNTADARIGHPPIDMPLATAVRIVTGAPLPIGADAVVRIEDVTRTNDRLRLTIPTTNLKPGSNIRRRAENAHAGGELVPAGTLLSAATICTLAAFGADPVSVHRRVRVAIISTGDELVTPGAAPTPWQLRDSNAPALAAMFAARRWIDVLPQQTITDDSASDGQLAALLRRTLESADAIILTGGVSMGHRDFVPAAVASIGARTIFHKLPQRPGKPMLAAIVDASSASPAKLILGLPGNPVSVMVTARRLAIPMLAKLAGLSDSALTAPLRTIAPPTDAPIDLWWHRLVSERHDTRDTNNAFAQLHIINARGSGDVAATAASAGFVELPPNQTGPGPWPFYAWDH